MREATRFACTPYHFIIDVLYLKNCGSSGGALIVSTLALPSIVYVSEDDWELFPPSQNKEKLVLVLKTDKMECPVLVVY